MNWRATIPFYYMVLFFAALSYVAVLYISRAPFDALVAVGLDGRRFQLLIGLGFLSIVLFSPDGVIGLWRRIVQYAWLAGNSNNSGNRSGH